MNRESMKRDIAIVGISCKFSKSENPTEFWESLILGREMIQFYSDKELKELGVEESTISNPSFIKRKMTLDNAGSFDYPFFGYTKDEANLMDPQARLMHEQVWLALEDAGYNPFSFIEKIGMFMTAEDNFNWIAHSYLSANKNVDPFYLSFISNKNFISSLLSFNLNLRGPSMVVDTACSSSLMTVHLASKSLLLRECSLAIAGGINLSSKLNKGYLYQEGTISSKDGYCRTFDIEASGTTGAEGAGVVVLKRLEEAIKDRDNIYGVIRSSAVNNDGKKIGYTAPSVKGQSECIRMAHKLANVSYDSITYVEAHGTGTKLGDPIEIEALNQSFNYDTSHRCAVGSLKSHLGHLGNAAGIGGLIKTVLSLKNKMIPGVKHFREPNPEINFKGGPFFVHSENIKWESNKSFPLRAGVSSFGIGGTNLHTVLEEFEIKRSHSSQRPFQLVAFSAKNEVSLYRYCEKLADFSRKQTFEIADLAYTLNIGRANFAFKNFIVASDRNDLLAGLNEKYSSARNEITNRDLVFMFPGQGCQYFKMGMNLYESEPDFKKIMDQGFDVLSELTGRNFRDVIGYSSTDDRFLEQINQTQHTQPLLFLIEYALAQVLLKWNIKPKNMIGHSLGEYTAACVAEVFSFEDALRLIMRRSQLMSELEKGDMVAIDAPVDAISCLLNPNISIAAVNSGNSCVVSGTIEGVADFTKLLVLKDILFTPLKTSHAFHSHMMDAILEKYEKELNNIRLSKPKFPFISNVTGKQILDQEAVSPKYWVRHLRETVRFKDGIELILNQNNNVFIELGPGKTLLSLARQSESYSQSHVYIDLMRHARDTVDDNKKFTNAIGELWAQGINVNWDAYYASEERHRISVPTYCFQKYTLDTIVDPFQKIINGVMGNSFEDWFYIQNWKKSDSFVKGNLEKKHHYLVFSDGTIFIEALLQRLKATGNSVIEVKRGSRSERVADTLFTFNPDSENNLASIFNSLDVENCPIDQVIFNWNFEGKELATMLNAFNTINMVCRHLINYQPNLSKKMTLLCNLGHEIIGDEKANISMISSMRQLYVCSQENPNIFSCSIDIVQNIKDPQIISKVVEDLQYNYSDTFTAYRNDIRWVAFYENVRLEVDRTNMPIKERKTYLITGGLGKIGKLLAAHLYDTYDSKVIIIGRTQIPSEELWDKYLNDPNVDQRLFRCIEEFKSLKKDRTIFYYQADVSNLEQFNHVVADIEVEHGNLSGVIHAAGNIESGSFKPIENLDTEIALNQFLPKVQGTNNLYHIFKDKPLDFVWITSSLASILGGLTFGAYSVANSFVDAFVNSNRRELKYWTCVNLDALSDDRIDDEKLLMILERTISQKNIPQVIVSIKDPNTFNLSHDVGSVNDSSMPIEERIIDRNALTANFLEPESETEFKLCDIIQSFFGFKKIGILDDFFEIGGDSLKAMTLIKRINKIFGIEMSIKDFYGNSNIRKLAGEIDLAVKVVNLQEKGNGEHTIII